MNPRQHGWMGVVNPHSQSVRVTAQKFEMKLRGKYDVRVRQITVAGIEAALTCSG